MWSEEEKAAMEKKKKGDEKDSENDKLDSKKNEKGEKIERIAGDTKPPVPPKTDSVGTPMSDKAFNET